MYVSERILLNKRNRSWSNQLSLAYLSHVKKKKSQEFTRNYFTAKIWNIGKDLKYCEAEIPAKINWNSCKKNLAKGMLSKLLYYVPIETFIQPLIA